MALYILINNEQRGPYSIEEINNLLDRNQLKPSDLAWREGLPEWRPLSAFSEITIKRSKAPVYLTLAAVGVFLIAVAGFFLVRKPVTGKSTVQNSDPKALSESKANGQELTPASFDAYPKTLPELNAWYLEPAAGQNGATFFSAATEVFDLSAAERASSNLPLAGKGTMPEPGATVPAAVTSAIAAAMKRFGAGYGPLMRGSECSASRYPINLLRGYDTPLPHLAPIKRTAQLLALSAMWHCEARLATNAIRDIHLAFAIAQSLQDEPLIISQLVRVASTEIAVNAFEDLCNRISVDPILHQPLKEPIQAAEQFASQGLALTRALVGEWVMHRVAAGQSPEKIAEAFGSKEGNTSPEEMKKTLTAIKKNLSADREFLDDTYKKAIAISKGPPSERLELMRFMHERLLEGKAKGYSLTTIRLPSADFAAREIAILTRLRQARIALALEEYRAEHKNYPDRLEDLRPFAAPIDPYTNEPFAYRKSGTGYSLESQPTPGTGTRANKVPSRLSFAVRSAPKA